MSLYTYRTYANNTMSLDGLCACHIACRDHNRTHP